MKASKILRKAAEMVICQHVAGCEAIDSAYSWYQYEEDKKRAQSYYASLYDNGEAYWFGYTHGGSGFHPVVNEENQNHRALALLLTADIAESVGD